MSRSSYYDNREKNFASNAGKGVSDGGGHGGNDSSYGFDKPTHDRSDMEPGDGFDDDDDVGGLFGRRITKQDIIYMTAQLAIMTDTGITLSVALAGIEKQEANPSMRKLLRELRQAVESGGDFSAALERYPKYFDKTYIALVKASEATGQFGVMLDTIAIYQRKEMEARSKVRAAMAYPAVMMIVAVGVTIFLLTYILPKFMPLFKSRGTQLPKPTIIMMSVSEIMLGYWWAWLIGFIALCVAFMYARKTDPGRLVIDYLKIHLPVIGPLFRKTTIGRSIRTLGVLLEAEVPIMESLKLVSQVSGNVYYEAMWLDALDQVAGGKQLNEAVGQSKLMPRVLVQMISAGEDTGKLDKVLLKVSTFYEHEVETSLKSATSLIEPLMICGMGALIGTIAMAMLLPIFSLSKQH